MAGIKDSTLGAMANVNQPTQTTCPQLGTNSWSRVYSPLLAHCLAWLCPADFDSEAAFLRSMWRSSWQRRHINFRRVNFMPHPKATAAWIRNNLHLTLWKRLLRWEEAATLHWLQSLFWYDLRSQVFLFHFKKLTKFQINASCAENFVCLYFAGCGLINE